MTIIRVNPGQLLIHSPTPLTQELRQAVADLGAPAWVIGPNKIHYWWISEWKAAFAGADIYLAPGIPERAGGRIDFSHLPLEDRSGYPWDKTITTLPISSAYMTEVEFFHRPTRPLVLTDLIENFEPHKPGVGRRLLAHMGHVADPDGQMPRDMRLTFARRRAEFREAVQEMIGWAPEQVIWHMAAGTRPTARSNYAAPSAGS